MHDGTARSSTYGQFCPVAVTAELLTRRWTPLVVRELLSGSRRFNEIRRGVPKMSPSLLSRRLAELERGGVIVRRPAGRAGHDEYHLTEAGEELGPIIMQMGVWGRRWAQAEIDEEDLDVGFLMWDVRRRLSTDRVPDRRVVVHFRFDDAPEEDRDYWLVLDGEEVDLCLTDPGYDVDLRVTTDVRTMIHVWMGDLPFAEALRHRRIEVRGPAKLRRAFPGWLGLSLLAGVKRPSRQGS